jgi:hypothetical protein
MATAKIDRQKMADRVVKMRDVDGLAWRAIGNSFDPVFAPRTARALYDEVKGTDAHYDSRIPGKGGRVRVVTGPEPTPKATSPKATPKKATASTKKAAPKATPQPKVVKATRRTAKAA